MELQPTNIDWIGRGHNLVNLASAAVEYGGQDVSAIQFLKDCGVIPTWVTWSRQNHQPSTSVNPENMRAGYLAEVAYEWDRDGWTSASEFVEMLEAETAGTPRNDIIAKTMKGLGS